MPKCSLPTIIIFTLLSSCTQPSQLDDPELVTSLRFSPSAFDSFKANTELRYTLAAPVTLSAFIVKADSIGNRFFVKSLVQNVTESKGSHSHTWLGDTDEGPFAPVGIYLGVIQIQHRSFEAAVLVFHY
jgi:hypothetical protein